MSTAKDSVISTPELLELTLSHLPMRDLLVTAPLVNKTWQALTLTPTLQRVLFFQADLAASQPTQNPLLAELFPPFFIQEVRGSWELPGSALSIKSMPWSEAPDAFKREEASWRRMLVTQPPARRLIVTETRHGGGGNYERGAVLKDPLLHMGVLYDLAVRTIARPGRPSFAIRWPDNLEGDVALVVRFRIRRNPQPEWRKELPKKFFSDGRKEVELDFGDWYAADLSVLYREMQERIDADVRRMMS